MVKDKAKGGVEQSRGRGKRNILTHSAVLTRKKDGSD